MNIWLLAAAWFLMPQVATTQTSVNDEDFETYSWDEDTASWDIDDDDDWDWG